MNMQVSTSQLLMDDVDTILNSLAISARDKHLEDSKHDSIRRAYKMMCPYAAAVFTQLILKDVSPILYLV